MIKKLEISGVHGEAGERLRKYVTKKVNRLERYIPRHARKSVHVEVHLKEVTVKGAQNYMAELIVHVPHSTLTAKETTVNIYAAVDIVEAKIKNQIRKYKETYASPSASRRLYNKLRWQVYS
jgi:putative sigma-54 modulation protein